MLLRYRRGGGVGDAGEFSWAFLPTPHGRIMCFGVVEQEETDPGD